MAGQRSMGTTLTLSGVASEADLVLANLSSIGELASEAEEVDTTTLDSPGGNMEFVQGSKDNGTVEVEANNVYDGQAEIINSLFSAGTTREWIVTYNSGATLTFNAYLSARAFGEATTDGLDKVNFTLRVTGEPVYVEA
jgi:hypothetical protein